VEKMKKNADVFEAYDNDLLIGVVSVYLNNFTTKIGFITSVLIDTEYQGKGIANRLLKISIDFAKEKGFEKIILEVFNSNINAIKLYTKNKFEKVTEECESNNFIKMELML
jgi:ribosomal-protein-alanine N-acetyltransferase